MIDMNILKKGGVVEKRGEKETKSMPMRLWGSLLDLFASKICSLCTWYFNSTQAPVHEIGHKQIK
jgi:hypothetical protein